MEIDKDILDTRSKIKKEMNRFMALNVMSIAFGGVAMAFAISSLTVNIPALITSDLTNMTNLCFNIVIGCIVAVFAIWFIISSVEVMSKFTEIQEENDEKNHSSEKLTKRIVNLLGLYREEKPQIKRMILVSKIAGVCFLGNAVLQTIILYLRLNAGSVDLISAVGGILVSIVMGAVGFFLPFSFTKYAVCWDERLVKSGEVEKKIASFMEENP
jgi:hypothetical protein